MLGQVITDLSTSVKEIVENSLDAKSTNIEITLKDMGMTSIQVSDNGLGIEPGNYDKIALKHFTSKINDFSDLGSLVSFGKYVNSVNKDSFLNYYFINYIIYKKDFVARLLMLFAS